MLQAGHSSARAGVMVEDDALEHMYDVATAALDLAAQRGERVCLADVPALRELIAFSEGEGIESLVLEIGLTPEEIRANIQAYRAQFPQVRELLRRRPTIPPAVRGEGAITLGAKLVPTQLPVGAESEDQDPVSRVLAEIFARRELDRLYGLVERRRRLRAALDLAREAVCALRNGDSPTALTPEARQLAATIGKGPTLERNLDAARDSVEDVLNDRHRDHRRRGRRDAHRFAPCRGKKAYYLGASLALQANTRLQDELDSIVKACRPRIGRQLEAKRRERRNMRQKMDYHDSRFGRVERRARELVDDSPHAMVTAARTWGLNGATREQLARGLEHLLKWLAARRGPPLPEAPAKQRASDELKKGLRQLGELVVERAAGLLAEELPPTDEDAAYFAQVAKDFALPEELAEERTR